MPSGGTSYQPSTRTGCIVTYAYGRRGSTLTTGRKTQHIVSLAEANKIHDQLVRQKTAKGYSPTGESRQPDRTSTTDGQDSGIRCQLLNPVDESELDRLLGSDAICLQEKFDGRRLMVRKRGDEITGINRRGLRIPVRIYSTCQDCREKGKASATRYYREGPLQPQVRPPASSSATD